MYEVMFFDIKKDIYSESLVNTLHIEIVKKDFLRTKQTLQKMHFLFLYELKHIVDLSKTMCGIFHFQFKLFFIKVYIFVQQKPWSLWLWNVIMSFKIKIIEKPHTLLLPDLWFLSCINKFENSMISTWAGAPQKLTWWQTF